MDENKKTSELMEEVLRQKILEFDTVDLESEGAKDAAEALAKAAEAAAKIEDAKEKKNSGLWKFLTILGTILGGAVTAGITAVSTQRATDKQLDYLDKTHRRAYEFEEFGKTEHVVVSPSAKDALKERPGRVVK